MKCLSCDVILNDVEQERKYSNHEEIKNPEQKYIGLCNVCFKGAMFNDDQLEYHETPIDAGGDCY